MHLHASRVSYSVILLTTCWVASPSGLVHSVDAHSGVPACSVHACAPEERACGFPLRLRGGGKGGCKAKHLSSKVKGRHFLVTKHAFPGLRQGAAHAVATGQNKSLVVTGVKRKQSEAGRYRAEDPEDSDSYSSWEVEEQHAQLQKRMSSSRAMPPEAGLIPMTSAGAKEFGAIDMGGTYMGRPIQILRRARDPRDGDVWGWGANYDGQLGIADGCRMDRWQPTRQLFVPDGAVSALAAGEAHSLILRDDGGVMSCGLNSHGQLGDGTRETRREPALLQFNALDQAPHAVAIAAGATHSLAVLESGDLLAWGCNSSGQLGPGPPLDPLHHIAALRQELGLEPDQVSDADMIELLKTLSDDVPRKLPLALTSVPLRKRRKAWHKVASTTAVTEPAIIRLVAPESEGSDALSICLRQIAGGPTFTIAVSKEGCVYQWGGLPWSRAGGGVGGSLGVLVPEQVSRVTQLPCNVVDVAAGLSHVLALTDNGQVWAWGCNDAGQLGVDGATDGSPALVVAEGASCIAAGGHVSAACLVNGTLLVWGAVVQPPPLQTHDSTAASTAISASCAAGPRRVQDLDKSRIVSVVVGGDGRVMARDELGALFAWGANHRGQCGFKGKRALGGRSGDGGERKFVEWGDKVNPYSTNPRRENGNSLEVWQRKGVEGGPVGVVAAPGLVRKLPTTVTAMAAGMHHALVITRV